VIPMSEPQAALFDHYDERSLQHEYRMLDIYRRESPRDAGLLQPLANACWRAASFEYALTRDVENVRRLWAEGALALAQGFSRKQDGFDPSPDQFILGLHLAIAGRQKDAFARLANLAPSVRDTTLRGAQAFRGARMQQHLAEGYGLIALAILEKRQDPVAAAIQSLQLALSENEQSWWEERFPDGKEAAWLIREHEALCTLLLAVAKAIEALSPAGNQRVTESETAQLARVLDEALLRLDQYVNSDANHHPKLYLWLPGVALCLLASAAKIPMNWLENRCQRRAQGYERLPLEVLGAGRVNE
jgi:hypothetical protein